VGPVEDGSPEPQPSDAFRASPRLLWVALSRPCALLALIHPSAWNRNSRKFTDTSGAPIVGFIAADISNTPPPSLFRAHMATIVARNRYERLRLATRKRSENFRKWAPQGAQYLR